MSFVGFSPEAVTGSSLTGLRVAYTVVPIIGVIGAIMLMWSYDISEEQAADVRDQLAKRKQLASS